MNPADTEWLVKIKTTLDEATELRREEMKTRGVK